jgi:hypothetical protein
MSMFVHVGKMCSEAFGGLSKIQQITKYYKIQQKIHAFVTSHLTIVTLCWLAYLNIMSNEFREYLMLLPD